MTIVDRGPAFDAPVAPGGYLWWYVDALSDDGRHGITLIAFVGSVFSPYYARARRRASTGAADASEHCAFNVALYGDGGARWAMTERGRQALERSRDELRIGPSSVRWHDDVLVFRIDETAVPWPRALRGEVRVMARRRYDHPVALAAQHHWQAIAPRARVEVDLTAPGLRWSGNGYLDSNRGDAPLEHAFDRWDWSRAHLPDGSAMVVYDLTHRDGDTRQIGLRFDPSGKVDTVVVPPPAALPPTAWRLQRGTRSDAGSPARLCRTLTDAPFYARSVVEASWCGQPVTAIHERLSLSRFERRWVQAMLPFRMPRRAG